MKEKFEAAGKAAKELGQWFTGDNNKRAAKAAEQKAGEYLERILDFQKIFEEQAKSSGEMLRLSDQVESEAEKFQTVQTAAMSTLRSTSRSVIMGGTALVVLLGLIITIFMTRGLTRPIKKGVELAGLISRGNLSNRLDIESRDEIGDLARALNVMADSLEKKAGLAAAISSGNLTMDAEMASDEDILGQALGGMVDSLNDVLGQVGTAVSQVAAGSGQGGRFEPVAFPGGQRTGGGPGRNIKLPEPAWVSDQDQRRKLGTGSGNGRRFKVLDERRL